MKKKEEASAVFKEGANCAQSVFSVFADDLGLTRESALRIASVFGGGMCSMGGTCGAVTGAFMALGLRHGVSTAEQPGHDEGRAHGSAQEFAKRFTRRNHSLQCRVLLGCDIGTPEGMKEIQAKHLFATRCVKFVEDAAEIAEEMM